MEEVYLVDFLRTAFSRSRPKEPDRDVFNTIRMDDALGMLIKEVVKRNNINPHDIGDVITGCALQVGENWLYGGRHPVFLAGLPVEVPSMAIDRQCASSMNAIAIGAMEIMTGNSKIALAGGMEHMTHIPMSDNPHIEINHKLLFKPEYAKYQLNIGYSMGLTAEKLAEINKITRDEMDEFALRSHKLASEALKNGWFKGEILPIQVESKGKMITVDTDQSIRPDTTLEQLKKLPPAFKPDGVITAGNSSPLNAGASLTMLMNEKTMNEYGLKPMAKIISIGWAAVDPSIMGEGPVPATKKALEKAKMNVEDIDYWEINEAFAVVVLNAVKKLGIDINKVNIHGGGISIGHPLGATGARIVGTLARILKEKNAKYGVATLCVGGGQGYSIILENAS
ncbi:MAG: acetyl-CoA C-acyltransferase [Caldisphaera sp.]|mgnify:CR=1 FL=1|uniref:acetyl-CoA C-acetyltransferase n=1 Tax=Caldisphaera sp. TaxID=2060322 RepID=UPI000CA7165D|nr:acetyl-CoA C-acetyltransferase [Caldisphaera sp.]PMP59774.1 MAG: acetyl-CoA C-acyltransferase [Caldisphaera sp.]PMP90940.1 MAG: acetyl-CoA C-acyltransferase [Caldisphaera sp.]